MRRKQGWVARTGDGFLHRFFPPAAIPRGFRRACFSFLLAGAALQSAPAITPNGNDFALYFREAKTENDRKAVLGEALGKPHFFRYLRITSIEEGETNGSPYVFLATCEPGSKMTVQFRVLKSVSLQKLRDEPASGVGDALAVTGVVRSADKKQNAIVLNPVIVRYKDRLAPKAGKEMMYEVDSSSIVYSFTGGKQAVNVSFRDRDLVQYKNQIMASGGKDGWAEFLLKEIARREKERAAGRTISMPARKADEAAATNQPPEESAVVDDEPEDMEE